jgi:hypothetical protein
MPSGRSAKRVFALDPRVVTQFADDIGKAADRGAELTQRLLAFGRRQILRPVEIECNDRVRKDKALNQPPRASGSRLLI